MPAWAEAYLTAGNPSFYPAIFGLILITGLGFPINADTVILVAGYLIFKGNAEFAPSLIAVLLGILISDTLMYLIAEKFGLKITRVWPFRKVLSPDRIERAKVSYAKHGYRIIFAARFMPGIRTVFVFTSGLLGLRYWKFIAYDTAGALIMVPLTLMSVSWVAGNTDRIVAILGKAQWGIVAVVAFFLIRFLIRRRNAGRLKDDSLALSATGSAETESDPSCPRT